MPFWQFFRGPGWPCPVSTALKNHSLDLKILFVFGSYEFLAMLEGKIRKGSFFYSRLWNRRTPLNKRSRAPLLKILTSESQFIFTSNKALRLFFICFSFKYFSKINKSTTMFILESRVGFNLVKKQCVGTYIQTNQSHHRSCKFSSKRKNLLQKSVFGMICTIYCGKNSLGCNICSQK